MSSITKNDSRMLKDYFKQNMTPTKYDTYTLVNNIAKGMLTEKTGDIVALALIYTGAIESRNSISEKELIQFLKHKLNVIEGRDVKRAQGG